MPRYTRPVGPWQLDSIKKSPGLNEKIDEHVLERMESTSLEYALEKVLRALDAGTPIFRERAAPRERLENCEASLSGHPVTTCRILDRSTTGLCLESPAQLKVGEDVEVDSGPTGTLRGSVIWNTSSRAGIRLAA